jgi:ElaB/YqjD/DUF883 family membrane-anchored ribosome-binding protein
MNADNKPEPKEAEKTLGAESADASTSQAMDAVHKAIDDLTGLLRGHAPDAVSALKDAGKAAGENIGDLARDLSGDARDIGRARLDELAVAVRRNPVASVAIAAGVGLIIGLWNNRGGRR